MLLTFGEKAEVLEPEEVRCMVRHIAEAMIKNCRRIRDDETGWIWDHGR